jgi:four helix bundle protein
MSAIRTHRDLIAWQEAMMLVEIVYRETASFPKEEIYGLSSQIKRSAVSIPSNLAEGSGRNSSRELLQFLGFACGSLAELETQLELAIRVGLLDANTPALAQADRVARLVRALRKSLKDRLFSYRDE